MGVLLDMSRNINNQSALLPNLNKTSNGSMPGSTKNAKTVSIGGNKLANTFSETSKESFIRNELVDNAPKSIKSLFEKLEFQMAEGENQDG